MLSVLCRRRSSTFERWQDVSARACPLLKQKMLAKLSKVRRCIDRYIMINNKYANIFKHIKDTQVNLYPYNWNSLRSSDFVQNLFSPRRSRFPDAPEESMDLLELGPWDSGDSGDSCAYSKK